MKYSIETLSGAQWLEIVNREEDPESSELKIRYLKIGNTYAAYGNSSYGKTLITDQPKTDEEVEKFFDKAKEEITKVYDTNSTKQIGPNLLSFGNKNSSGLTL